MNTFKTLDSTFLIMQGKQQNWVTHSAKRNLFIVLIAWMVANGLLMISITDLFRETFFNKRYVLIYALMLMSTWTMVKVISNYLKSNETNIRK